jgi:hypothetical protein
MSADGPRSRPISTHMPVPKGSKLLPDVPAGVAIGGKAPVHLIYVGWLPRISGHQVHKFARSRLSKRARIAFGVLPPLLYPQTHAYVQIIRVLGPRQKPMDDDSIMQLTVGLRDALKPSYIVDDSPRWATFTYRNEDGRRFLGPRIEVRITYDGA